MSEERVEVNVNKEALPEHFRIISIVYDPQKDQMQIQGHLSDPILFDKMMRKARTEVDKHHASLKKDIK